MVSGILPLTARIRQFFIFLGVEAVTGSSFTAVFCVGSRRRVIGGIRFKFKILVNDVEDIHKLAFIGMDTFNLDIEEGGRVGRDILLRFNEIGE